MKQRTLSPSVAFVCIIMLFFFSLPLLAEHVFLKDGSIQEGSIARENDRAIVLQTRAKGTREIPRADILRVVYNNEFSKLKYIGIVKGNEIAAYIVDESADAYVYRTELDSSIETTLPKNRVEYVSLNSIQEKLQGKQKPEKKAEKTAPAKNGDAPAAGKGIWANSSVYPSFIDRHRIGISLGSGIFSSTSLANNTETGWSGIALGLAYEWKYLDIDAIVTIGDHAINANALSFLCTANAYPIPYFGIGVGVHYLQDLFNIDTSRDNGGTGPDDFLDSQYTAFLYGFSFRLWRFRLGCYSGILVDHFASYVQDGYMNPNEYSISPAQSARDMGVWLITLKGDILEYLSISAMFQMMGGNADYEKGSVMSREAIWVNAYLGNVMLTYSFVL